MTSYLEWLNKRDINVLRYYGISVLKRKLIIYDLSLGDYIICTFAELSSIKKSGIIINQLSRKDGGMIYNYITQILSKKV